MGFFQLYSSGSSDLLIPWEIFAKLKVNESLLVCFYFLVSGTASMVFISMHCVPSSGPDMWGNQWTKCWAEEWGWCVWMSCPPQFVGLVWERGAGRVGRKKKWNRTKMTQNLCFSNHGNLSATHLHILKLVTILQYIRFCIEKYSPFKKACKWESMTALKHFLHSGKASLGVGKYLH